MDSPEERTEGKQVVDQRIDTLAEALAAMPPDEEGTAFSNAIESGNTTRITYALARFGVMLEPSFTTRIQFVRGHRTAQLPERAKVGDAGADVRWCFSADAAENARCAEDVHTGTRSVSIPPGETMAFSTGLAVADIPLGYELQVRPRSGLAAKQGLTVLNSPGTIDAGYRGVIKVLLHNTSTEPQEIADGDRIAQIVVARVQASVFEFADYGTESERGEGGFGSSGKK